MKQPCQCCCNSLSARTAIAPAFATSVDRFSLSIADTMPSLDDSEHLAARSLASPARVPRAMKLEP